MPPRSRTPRGPAPVDVDALRARLAAGGRVRVGIRASGQFPDGAVGMVRHIGDPGTDGADYVQVETSLGGVKDLLPFAPADLVAPPGRGVAATVQSGTAGSSGPRTPPSRAPLTPPPATRTSAGAKPSALRGVAVERPPVGSAGSPAAGPRGRAPAAAAAPGNTGQSGSPITGSLAPGRRAAIAPKIGPATARTRQRRAPVTVTIATTGDESAGWTVEARIGARVSLKPIPVSPARVWEIVSTLGEPRLTALVQTLLAEHREATQARVDALARELAAVRAELRAYPNADS